MSGDKGAVLVTGASTGIGRATVLELDRRGFGVFAGVRSRKDADSIRAEGSDRLSPVTLDVANPRSIASASTHIGRKLGGTGLVGLVNNAGIGAGGPIEHLPMEEFRRVIEVNLNGTVAVTKAFLPLIRRSTGRVVFITSIGGRVAYPFMSPYNASKFGLEAVADSLRREVRPWGIKVVVVEPGSIDTPIWEKAGETARALIEGLPPEGRRHYGRALESFTATLRISAERGIKPERVARIVRRALTHRFPDTRYRVGLDARAIFVLSRLLGDRLFDRLLARAMKLPRRAPN